MIDIFNIEKTIEKQEQIIKDEVEKLDQLKAIDLTHPITEEYFHKLCETPLRNDRDAMCEIVHMIFPTATDINCGANYVSCKISDFNILVPTSRIRGLEVACNYTVNPPDEKTYFSEDKNIDFLTKYIELLDTNASWYKKARARHRYLKNWTLFFWWFFRVVPRDLKEHKNRGWFVNQLNEKLEYKRDNYLSQLREYNRFLDKWEVYFNEVEPVLKQYTDTIRRYQNHWGEKNFFESLREQIKQRKQEVI